MPYDPYPDEKDSEVYDDYEEYVDLDEHERVRTSRKKAREEHARKRAKISSTNTTTERNPGKPTKK